jgi:hypothetical protein
MSDQSVVWRRIGRCSDSVACVDVADLDGGTVLVRQSDRLGVVLELSREEAQALGAELTARVNAG